MMVYKNQRRLQLPVIVVLLFTASLPWCVVVESFIVTKGAFITNDLFHCPCQQHVALLRRYIVGTTTTTTATTTNTRMNSSSESIEKEGSVVEMTKDNDIIASLGLTSELEKMVTAFANIGDDKLRYKQLLYMANQLPPFDSTKQIIENKVPGCLSTVYIDGYAKLDDNSKEYRIYFVGDSDGLLTKGLVSLLVRGLSGNTASAIQNINPTFIHVAGIATSLTPGRNNGFLNMLTVMKRKATEIETAAKLQHEKQQQQQQSESGLSDNDNETSSYSERPMYDAIMTALQVLKPEVIDLIDTSYQHAGHAGTKNIANDGSESHFELYIVADAFDGLNLIKRHKLVYMMLNHIMPQIHALNIKAKTPQEVTTVQ